MMWGKFTNAGQTCVAADHVYVDAEISDAFIRECKKAIVEFYGEEPQKSKDLARIINDRAWEDLSKVLEDARKYIVCGGGKERRERYIAPTILDYGSNIDAWSSSMCMENEIFGPILPMRHYSHLDEVIEEINSREKPLALYAFSNNSIVSERLLRETSSGHAVVNDILLQFCAPIPFGGVGGSGSGSYHGKWSFKTFSHEKGVLKRHVYGEIPARFPPYGVAWKSLLVSTLTKPFPHKHLRWVRLLSIGLFLRFTPFFRYVAPYIKAILIMLANRC